MLAGRSVLARRLAALPIEAVVRGYLIGSGWKDYQATGEVCGIALPGGLQQAQRLPEPLFTPATKAAAGSHDENIPFAQAAALVGAEVAARVRDVSLALYAFAAAHAEQRGIIIADTKFEFGLTRDGTLILIDEALTPDSSRFWPADSYRVGTSPPSFDKQYVRDYLETLDWDKRAPARDCPRTSSPAPPPAIAKRCSDSPPERAVSHVDADLGPGGRLALLRRLARRWRLRTPGAFPALPVRGAARPACRPAQPARHGAGVRDAPVADPGARFVVCRPQGLRRAPRARAAGTRVLQAARRWHGRRSHRARHGVRRERACGAGRRGGLRAAALDAARHGEERRGQLQLRVAGAGAAQLRAAHRRIRGAPHRGTGAAGGGHRSLQARARQRGRAHPRRGAAVRARGAVGHRARALRDRVRGVHAAVRARAEHARAAAARGHRCGMRRHSLGGHRHGVHAPGGDHLATHHRVRGPSRWWSPRSCGRISAG